MFIHIIWSLWDRRWLYNINIGVKFCGFCNSNIDGQKLYELIIKKTKQYEMDISKYNLINPQEYDLLILINGCYTECLLDFSKKRQEIPKIIIKGLFFNNRTYKDERELAETIVVKLLKKSN